MFSFEETLKTQYRNSGSPMHRLDPRVKLAWAVAMLLLVAFSLDTLLYLGLTVYLITVVTLSRIPLGRVLPQLRALILLFVLTFTLHVLFTEPAGHIYWRISGVVISERGVTNGLLYSYRVFLFLMTALVLNMSTSPVDIADGLVSIFGPLRKLRLPIDDLGMMLFVALRFIPVMSEETRAIRDAQMSRGAERAKGLIGRVRSVVPLVLPLLVSSVRKAHYLALAIQSRGYKPGSKRTSLRVFKFGTNDALFVTASIAFLLVTLTIRRMLAK